MHLRLVLDTNVVVSGLLWGGHSRHLLTLGLSDTVTLFSSPVLIEELTQTLQYTKLGTRISALQTTAQALVAHYSAMVTLLNPEQVPRVVERDADDDHVLACALQTRAHLIVTGDRDLLSLGASYQGIHIVTPAEAAELVQTL